MHAHRHAVGQLFDGFAVFSCTSDNLVIDIGDISDVFYFKSSETQVAYNHIEADKGSGMADMAQIIDCHAAYIHADPAWNDWNKFFLVFG